MHSDSFYSFFRTILESESQPKVVGMVRGDLTAWLKEVQLEHHNELCQLLEDLGVESLEDFSPVQWFVINLFNYFEWQAQEVFDYRRPKAPVKVITIYHPEMVTFS